MSELFNIYGKNVSTSNHPISVVVVKPTRVCNAHCTYCSSPPLEEMGAKWEPEWNFSSFKVAFDKIFPYMADGSYWIWHGGEPMLMGVDFYWECYNYACEKMLESNKKIRFSMQTNLLGYNDKWRDLFLKVFDGSFSTSYDPDKVNRKIKKSWENYDRIFKKSLSKALEDGFYPMVIGVYTEENAKKMQEVYDWSLSLGDNGFPVRFNYCVPTGRSSKQLELISPETYGQELISVYNRWIKDVPVFTVTPLDQMFKKVISIDGAGHCPWLKNCGGKFLAIESTGDVYNCYDFADIGEEFKFGNIYTNTMSEILNSKPSLDIRKRTYKLPQSCLDCEHFQECEGGCARDSELFNNGLYGKFHYCRSWKLVFSRIKESIISGEADEIIIKYGLDPEIVKNYTIKSLNSHFKGNLAVNDFKLINKYTFSENFNVKPDDFSQIELRKKIIPILIKD